MSNATIERLERINTVYVQTIREQDARIAELEAQLAAATALRPDETDTLTPDELRQEVRNLYATIEALHGEINGRNDELFAQGRQLAAAQERERAVVELMRTIFHPDHWHNSVGAMVVAVHAALAAASEKGGAE